MSELKPCPFCGGTVGWKSGEINCIVCGLRFRKRSSYEGNNEAWNERTYEQRIAELEAERDDAISAMNRAAGKWAAADARARELEQLVRDMHAWFTGGDEYCDTCELSARCDEDYGDDCGMRTVFEGRMSALGIEVDA